MLQRSAYTRLPALILLRSVAVAALALGLAGCGPKQESISSSALSAESVEAFLDSAVSGGWTVGAMVMAVGEDGFKVSEVRGWSDLQNRVPLSEDSIFRLASLTKPVTAVALMMLHDEGYFHLDDPIARYLPAFRNPSVLDPDAIVSVFGWQNRRRLRDKVPVLSLPLKTVPAEREITFRHLLSHTSGLVSWYAPLGKDLSAIDPELHPDTTLRETVDVYAGFPLYHQPGSAFLYASTAFDVAARLVEVISGQAYPEFLRERLFGPLGMSDTHFYLPAEKRDRLAKAYVRRSGEFALLEGPWGTVWLDRPPRYYSGAWGLHGTATDYLRFLQFLANRGRAGEKQLLSESAVTMITSNQVGVIPLGVFRPPLDGYRFGLGVRVRERTFATLEEGTAGSFGWYGHIGTYAWVDPLTRLAVVYLSQSGVSPAVFGTLEQMVRSQYK